MFRLVERLSEIKKTICTAESCTGGLIGYQIVSVPGASRCFLGSIIAYSDKSKIDLLAVSSETLKAFGAVSEAVASEMAVGALNAFGADFALATTGIAGPTCDLSSKPIGLVAFAIAQGKEGAVTWTKQFFGDRAAIIEAASKEAFEQILLRI